MIRTQDTVIVKTGQYKGKIGKVKAFAGNDRLFVEKLNIVKRHQKANQKLPRGGIVEKEASLHRSNVMLYCNKCSKGVRVSVVLTGKGADKKKNRKCRKCGENLG